MAEPPNLQEIHDLLMVLVKKAGEMITSATPTTSAVDTKKNSSDLVTETDQAVEAMISTALRIAHPGYSFLGEETYRPGMRLTDAPTFVCDPIDGTTNFVHTFPYACISLGFTHLRRPLVGIVYNPFSHQCYHAIHGQGAFLTILPPPSSPATSTLNSPYVTRRLPTTAPPPGPLELSSALLAVEWGNERSGQNFTTKVNTFRNLAAEKGDGGAMVHSLRSLGSAALNLCAVAEGYLDAYWEGGCWAWDVAAGWVILEEAGGAMHGGNKGEWKVDVDARAYLAVRAGVGKEFVEGFWGHVGGKLVYDV